MTKADVAAIAANEKAMKAAANAFLSVPKSFTIRGGKAVGKDQLAERLSRAIAAYQEKAAA